MVGGLSMSLIGLAAAIHAMDYEFGSLSRMGPGYFPVGLGLLLTLLGLAVAVPAFFRQGHSPTMEWKAFACVLGSLLLFAFALKPLGLVLATVLAVVLASLADRETRWKGRLLTAGGVALMTYLVFSLGLRMILPIWPWSA